MEVTIELLIVNGEIMVFFSDFSLDLCRNRTESDSLATSQVHWLICRWSLLKELILNSKSFILFLLEINLLPK